MDSVEEDCRGQTAVKLAGLSRVRGLRLIIDTSPVLPHASFVADAVRTIFGVI